MRNSQKHRLRVHLLAAGAVAVAIPVLAATAQAQTPAGQPATPALVLQTGHWYAGVDGIVGAIRAELPMDGTGRWLFVPGITYSHYTLDSPVPEIDLFAPEALIHLQLAQGRVRPYVGGGAGLVLINMFHTIDPVLTLGAGLRADLSAQWSARLELDTRAFGQFNTGSVGWGIGLARRF